MLTLRLPHAARRTQADGHRQEPGDAWDEFLCGLMHKCWTEDPDDRPVRPACV